ncbi:WXG100 family type VII secretion target [Nocardia sp. NPDC059764]|uniref:WXG100 family type VII secretion target n=1 Tax=Nocardia sp. NPDC059764 TaxID=3346939 RepID=UPI00365627C2
MDTWLQGGYVTSESENSTEIFQVVPAEVTDAGQFMQMTAEELISGMRSLDNEVADLLKTWRGRSATDYSNGWTEVHKGAAEVLQALKDMAELLGVTGIVFADMDQGNASGFGSLLNLPPV